MLLPLLALTSLQRTQTLFGKDVGIRVLDTGTELVEELYAVRNGIKSLILVSPTHPSLKRLGGAEKMNLLQGSTSGLFGQPPTFGFNKFQRHGNTITLSTTEGPWKVEKTLTIPAVGNEIRETVKATTDSSYPRIRYLLSSYAFAPGKPDNTFAPAIRPGDQNVIGDHFFRAPVVMAQKGPLSAALIPDLDVLADNRPMPTILDLDCKNGIVAAPLMSYGFCDYKLVGHVYFANDASMLKPVPSELNLGMSVILDPATPPTAGHEKPAKLLWTRYGARYFDKILPQAMPFAQYAEVCYPAAFNEKMTGGWFQKTIDGQVCGGIPAGWGLTEGWVSWQGWFNQLRSAWGVRWWGKKLNRQDWVDKADMMLNLALAAPIKKGAVPTTYQSKTNEWKGSLITPSPDCYYDLTNMAWKGIAMLKWLEFKDCPRRAEIERQLDLMGGMMLRFQNTDGSFPTWLSKDLNVVPVLDHSAQSALPAWFLSLEMARKNRSSGLNWNPDRVKQAVHFLESSIVPKSLYYDFETFFSCSPKACFQRDGKLDDLQMWDMHTMQPPQNTLSMQWCAEALRNLIAYQTGRTSPQLLGPSLSALDQMTLYQNVWPISYRKVAYTYGGFGVQNSDGEYNDARQAQFGVTLCDFGSLLGRKDYFERGVAAVRASLTLINHPLHIKLGIYPDPNYPLGLEPENDGHGGSDEQDGRTGFDWGEGSGLASAAMILDKFGSTYQSKDGWSVIIDPDFKTLPAPRWPVQAPMSEARAFAFNDWRMPGWSFDGTFLPWATASKRFNFNSGGRPFIGTCEDGAGGYDDTYTGTITSPQFLVNGGTLKLMVGGGSGEGVYVELLDPDGNRVDIERGHNSERMDERSIDVSRYRGIPLQLRIVDQEKGGWGHINVGYVP